MDATRVILVSDSRGTFDAADLAYGRVQLARLFGGAPADGLEQLTLTVDLPGPYHG